jgi:hypothetical protein
MLDDDFLVKMEWEIIPNALEEIGNPDTSGCWCDGVMITVDTNDTKKFVNDKRHITLKAFMCREQGVEEYDLILLFGPKALSRYARELSILECIPNAPASEWFYFDVQKQTMEIQLL